MNKFYIALLTFLPVITHSADYTPYQSTGDNKRRRLNSPCESSSNEDSILCFSDPEDDTPYRSSSDEEDIICIPHSSDEEDIICIPHSSDDDSTCSSFDEDEESDIDVFPQVASSRGSESFSNSITTKNKIDNNPELESFIRQKRKEKWGTDKIERNWNRQHQDQKISARTIGKWLKRSGLPMFQHQPNKIANNPALEEFIKKKKEEKCSSVKIARAWNEQHQDQKISASTIIKWLKRSELRV